MVNKKTISSVVATALLLVVSVVAVVHFQGWFNDFSSSIFTGVQQQSAVGTEISVQGLIGDILYLKSGSDTNLTILKVIDGSGNEMCSFSGSTDIDSSGLVGWWTFDSIEYYNTTHNKTLDLSENGNDGYFNNSPNLVSSKLGNAYEFDGIDDYVEVLDDDSLDLINNFSIIAIFKKEYNPFSNRVLSKHDSEVSTPMYDLFFANNAFQTIGSRFTNQSFKSDYFQTTNLSKKYYSVVYIYNSSYNLNVNNNFLTFSYFGNVSGNIKIGNGSLYFAKSTYNNRYFKGQIDEIRIYNRTLTDDEIKTLYWYSIKPQEKGINQIDLSSCNINKGSAYNILAFTNNQKVEHTLIAK